MHEASPNLPDSRGSSPLHLACWAGHQDIVNLLLTQSNRPANPNLQVKQPHHLLLIWSPFLMISIFSHLSSLFVVRQSIMKRHCIVQPAMGIPEL